MKKIIKLNLEGEDIRYLNPSCIKEVKKNKSNTTMIFASHLFCKMTTSSPDYMIITRMQTCLSIMSSNA